MFSAVTVKCIYISCLHIDTEEKETNNILCYVCLKKRGKIETGKQREAHQSMELNIENI